jgi:two-component system, NtrC family, nitrogen regulation sensor histidine kinase NtrY
MLHSLSVQLFRYVAAILALSVGIAWFCMHPSRLYGFAVILAVMLGFIVWHLYQYLNDTNRRLARLFESIRYADFAIRFSQDIKKGDTFAEVNREFNAVLEAFRQTRAEKEANLLFLNTIVQHLSTGVIVLQPDGRVLTANAAAFQQLGIYRLHHLDDLPQQHQDLTDFVRQLDARGKLLYQPAPTQQLSVQGLYLSMQGRAVQLITLQNIHPELQRKELDAWRDLTRVLRHEIMNSITPITSLVDTARAIVAEDLADHPARQDLLEALDVVGSRSRGLMDFVDAYRSYTSIPAPRERDLNVEILVERVRSLNATVLKNHHIQFDTEVEPTTMTLRADPDQIEMVLINLVKNAIEAFPAPGTESDLPRKITIQAGLDARQRPFIAVEDTGAGIAHDLLEEIFIPFFTTKTTGTGIGLSISRQIMQRHGGDLQVQSAAGKGSRFRLVF